MADLQEQLQREGWFLSGEGLKQLSDDGKITNPKIIIKKALDIDLREISSPGFPEEVGRCKVEGIPGGIVVQLQKVRNVSAPKANEESGAAPRMLKLTLTDGHSTCHAVEIERIPSLTLNTPPGTKILLKSKSGEEKIPVCSNFLLLNADRAEVLGGKVVHMIEKWELVRSLAKHKRTGGEEGGPPAWIPFGQKIVRSNPLDKNFKSIQEKDKPNSEIVNPEFEAQRKDAIAEAGKAGAKKVFGGGNRQLLDHNVQQIVEFGFSIEQAENALKMSRNNVERALKILQRQTDGSKGNESKKPEKDTTENRTRENPRDAGRDAPRGSGKGSNREGGKSRGHDEEVGAPTPSKPSGRVSLFDFLEDKLPLDEKEKLHASSMKVTHDRGGRGLGGSHRGSANGRGARPQDREPRSSASERGGRGGRGRGGDRKSDRNPREENHQRDDGRFRDRKDQNRGKDAPDNSKAKKEGPASSRNSAKAKPQQPPPTDIKAPRFNSQKPPLQHESSRYLGQTPSNAVSTNSSIGRGVPDWESSMSRKVEMMSMIDCENTPDDDVPYGNSSWSSSQRDTQPPTFHHHQQQQQHFPRPNEMGRNANQGQQHQRSNQHNFKQNNDFRNNSYENDSHGSKGAVGGAPGGSRNMFNNMSMPKIPDFPFKDNIHIANPLANGGYSGNLGNSNNAANANNPGNSRNMGNPNPRNQGSNRNVFSGANNRTDNPPNVSSAEESEGTGVGVHWSWKLGDECIARYWEDERYYDAVVTGIASRTLVVRFIDYGNHEEVLKQYAVPVIKPAFSESLRSVLNSGCSPSSLSYDQFFDMGDVQQANSGNFSPKSVNSMNSTNSHNSFESGGVPFSGIMEFRRGGNRPYVKQSNAEVTSPRERRPARAPQSMYVPPAQRK